MRDIRIDIVSDVVCPWCYIGYRRLNVAMEELAGEMRFDIEWHPFELNPDMPPEGEDAGEHLMRKYGMNREQLQLNRDRLVSVARDLGISINPGERRIYNTFDAHRVLRWAASQGQQTAFEMALFKAYFADGLNPSDPAVLRSIAESLGLSGDEAESIAGSDRYADEVRAEERQYVAAGIQAVPAYIIDRKYLISGGQEPATFVSALRRIAAE